MVTADSLTSADLQQLINWKEGPCVSLYMPTHKNLNEDRIRLRNLLRKAESRLDSAGWNANAGQTILAPAYRLLEDTKFWSFMSRGLTVHLSPSISFMRRLPVPFADFCSVARTFHVKPLFAAYIGSPEFYVLVLTEKSRTLYHGNMFGLEEVDLRQLPKGMVQALLFDNAERQLRWHSGFIRAAGGFGVYHGQSSSSEEAAIKRWLRDYCCEIDRGIRDFLGDSRTPLFVAAFEPIFSIYREVNTYKHMAQGNLRTDLKHISKADLHAKAWLQMEARREAVHENALRRYGELKGAGLTAEGIAHILPACLSGQVDTLFIDLSRQLWGSFEQNENLIRLSDGPAFESRDLYDLAAAQAWLKGADIQPVSAENFAPSDGVAAILRFSFQYRASMAQA